VDWCFPANRGTAIRTTVCAHMKTRRLRGVVTRKTVETHLGHVFRKLGISGRTELGPALADQKGQPATELQDSSHPRSSGVKIGELPDAVAAAPAYGRFQWITKPTLVRIAR
jgi:hypothetical protein